MSRFIEHREGGMQLAEHTLKAESGEMGVKRYNLIIAEEAGSWFLNTLPEFVNVSVNAREVIEQAPLSLGRQLPVVEVGVDALGFHAKGGLPILGEVRQEAGKRGWFPFSTELSGKVAASYSGQNYRDHTGTLLICPADGEVGKDGQYGIFSLNEAHGASKIHLDYDSIKGNTHELSPNAVLLFHNRESEISSR